MHYEYWMHVLPIIIYILLILFLIVGIILAIKTIITMDKVNKIVDSVNTKVESLNSIFNLVDFASDKITIFVEKTIDFASNLISKLWYKKSIDKEDGEDE